MTVLNRPVPLKILEALASQEPEEAQATLTGVTRYFKKNGSKELFHALGPIDLTLMKGEFFSVVGPSGCGKSTLLDALAGLSEPSSGSVTFEGRAVKGVPDGVGVVFQEDASFPWLNVHDNISFGLRMAGVGVVFQEDASFPWLNVHDNISFGLRMAGMDGAEIKRRTDYAMGFMGLK